MKLNVGCGHNIKAQEDGWINIDYFGNDGADVVIDLNRERLTDYFADDSIDFIYISHVLEHLVNPYECIMDCHRILKKDCVVKVRLPTTCRGSIAHLRTGHPKGYFWSLKNPHQSSQGGHYFDIEVKGSNIRTNGWKEFIYRQYYVELRDWVHRRLYGEFIYKLKKK